MNDFCQNPRYITIDERELLKVNSLKQGYSMMDLLNAMKRCLARSM